MFNLIYLQVYIKIILHHANYMEKSFQIAVYNQYGVHQPGLVSFPHTSCFLRSLSGTAAGHHYAELAAILRPAVATGQTAVLETFLILSHL